MTKRKETRRPTKTTVQVKMTARWGSVFEVFSTQPPPLPSRQISRMTFTSGVHSVDFVQTSHRKWVLSCHFQRSQTPNNLTARKQQQKEFSQTWSLRACRSGVKSLPEIFYLPQGKMNQISSPASADWLTTQSWSIAGVCVCVVVVGDA